MQNSLLSPLILTAGPQQRGQGLSHGPSPVLTETPLGLESLTLTCNLAGTFFANSLRYTYSYREKEFIIIIIIIIIIYYYYHLRYLQSKREVLNTP